MKVITKYVIITSIMSIYACSDFVEVGQPEDVLTTETVFSSDATANSALAGLYSNTMATGIALPFTLASNTGLYSDELDYKLSAASQLSVYRNLLNAIDSPTNNIWTNVFKLIYQANGIIQGVSNSTKLSNSVKKQLKGEALFIRAYLHFYLCNLYGKVPYVKSIDYNVNSVAERNSVEVVYDNIVSDLLEAKGLLTEKYVAKNSITETLDRIRPNLRAVSAFLSRVYLYLGEWQLAEEEATSVISDSRYSLENISQVFKITSKEAIWSLQMPTPISATTYEAMNFVLQSKPSGVRHSVVSTHLLNQFSSTDLRRQNWIGSYTDRSVSPNVVYNFPYKYKTTITTSLDEQSICLRLAEVVLNRAEARAKQDKIASAIEDVDRVRLRAAIGLIKNDNPNISKADLIDSIYKERRRELFCEWGHRWMDLRRTGKVDAVMNVVTPQKGGGDWIGTKALWPVPANDIFNNHKFVQNDGYN